MACLPRWARALGGSKTLDKEANARMDVAIMDAALQELPNYQAKFAEVQEKKQKIVFPTKDASIVVVLHENHKIYYSYLYIL